MDDNDGGEGEASRRNIHTHSILYKTDIGFLCMFHKIAVA